MNFETDSQIEVALFAIVKQQTVTLNAQCYFNRSTT